jgi:hypothetical protein
MRPVDLHIVSMSLRPTRDGLDHAG